MISTSSFNPFRTSRSNAHCGAYLGTTNHLENVISPQILDSYFIGDRIQLNEMGIYDSKITLSFNQHGDKQAYAEAPTETVHLTLGIDDVMPTKLIKHQDM